MLKAFGELEMLMTAREADLLKNKYTESFKYK